MFSFFKKSRTAEVPAPPVGVGLSDYTYAFVLLQKKGVQQGQLTFDTGSRALEASQRLTADELALYEGALY